MTDVPFNCKYIEKVVDENQLLKNALKLGPLRIKIKVK
jgi:hypothetical protein